MHAVLFLLAFLPWANAQSTSTSRGFDNPITNPTITLQSPGNLESCDAVNIEWLAPGLTGTHTAFTINYTNEGAGGIVDEVIFGVATVVDATSQVASWRVNVPKSGRYILTGSADGVVVYPSEPFVITVSDTSCYDDPSTTVSTLTPTPAPSITTSSSSSLSASTTTTSSASTDPSEVPAGGSGNGSKVASIVGATFGVVIFVALLAAFFFYRRQRSLKTRTYTNSKPEKPKSRQKWGGLTSVDNAAVPEGIPTVPYAAAAFANSRGESVNKPATDEDTVEKGIPVYEEESPADEVPTLSPRSHNRYSSGVLTAALAQQNSGLAAFNNERARTTSLQAVSPSASFVEDPFSDNAFRARGARSKSLSVPSTAHPSPRSSTVPTLPGASPSPTQEGPGSPRISDNGRPESFAFYSGSSTMGRSTSANAIARPARKPVPQYDSSIEMTTTTGIHSSYAQHSAQNSVTNLTNDSHIALGSSVDSTSPWLIERAPVATRNIGLASQGDGPVHYLMPDMPPPPRD